MKKRNTLIVLLVLITLQVFAGCSPSQSTDTTATPSAAAEEAAADPDGTTEASSEKTFTLAELAEYDGKDGSPAYIAVDGVVYDVSDVPEWAGGDHWGKYSAGNDLTEEIKNESPHGVSKLEGLPVVGTLAE